MIQTEIDKLIGLPLLALIACAIAALCLDLYRKDSPRLLFTACAFLLPMGCLIPCFLIQDRAFQGMLFVDPFTGYFCELILVGALLCLFLSHDQLENQKVKNTVDVDILMIFATLGGMLMVASANLLMFFVGFEMLSIAVYVLSGAAKREAASSEAAMKYFILGAFSSAFMLYGIALIYGATGTVDIPEIGQYLAEKEILVHGGAAVQTSPLLLLGLGLLMFGFCFKLGAVPFHFWAPDVYQGAPVSITAFMAVVVKVAAFGGFLRVMHGGFGHIAAHWEGLIWTISAATMTVGNVMALRQKSMKRMLAYSSVAHAGYALMGFLVVGGSEGVQAVAFYLLAYTFMSVVAFGSVLLVTGGTDEQYSRDSLESFRGLGWKNPTLAILISVSMLALAGIPPLAGFMGKLMLFTSAIRGGFVGLAVIAALNSVISLYYYLGVLVVLYFSPEDQEVEERPADVAFMPAFAVCMAAIAIVYFGLFSEGWMDLITSASRSVGA